MNHQYDSGFLWSIVLSWNNIRIQLNNSNIFSTHTTEKCRDFFYSKTDTYEKKKITAQLLTTGPGINAIFPIFGNLGCYVLHG